MVELSCSPPPQTIPLFWVFDLLTFTGHALSILCLTLSSCDPMLNFILFLISSRLLSLLFLGSYCSPSPLHTPSSLLPHCIL